MPNSMDDGLQMTDGRKENNGNLSSVIRHASSDVRLQSAM